MSYLAVSRESFTFAQGKLIYQSATGIMKPLLRIRFTVLSWIVLRGNQVLNLLFAKMPKLPFRPTWFIPRSAKPLRIFLHKFSFQIVNFRRASHQSLKSVFTQNASQQPLKNAKPISSEQPATLEEKELEK